jgi:peptidyl-prolyl cis-trans isomerase SurA
MRGSEPLLVDQVRARHILLEPTEVLDDEATRQRLLGIRERLLEGDDFAAVAAAVSDDAFSSVDGGDLGWRVLEDYDQVFAEELVTLEVDELSEPFQSSFGWHLAEVTGRRNFDMTDELRSQTCEDQIRNRKVTEGLEIWRQRLLDDAYIVRRL